MRVAGILVAGGVTVAIVLLAPPSRLHAQQDRRAQAPSGASPETFSGTWRAGTTTMAVSIESWGGDCGPRPEGSRSEGGGSVIIDQTGEQLTIQARGRQVKTDTCWGQNPALRKQDSETKDGLWTTRCRTPPDDPREEAGTYTIRAHNGDSLTYRDVSRYNWRLKDSTCVATITTTQSLNRVKAPAVIDKTAEPIAPAVPIDPWAEDEPEPDAPCEPGPARRIVVRPREVQIELGARRCFRARVLDGSGCPLVEPEVRWSLEHSRAIKGRLSSNCFTAGDNAAEAEGEFVVVARHRSLKADAKVHVQAADLSALLAKRLETGALSGFEQEPETPPPSPSSKRDAPSAAVKTREVAAVEREETSPPFLLGGAAILLLVAALALSMRRRTAASRVPASSSTRQPIAVDRVTESQPPEEGEDESGAPDVDQPPAQAASPGGFICPTCRQGYSAPGSCARDGSALMPYAEFVQGEKAREQASNKRCPTCGGLFPQSSEFCSHDGTRLVAAEHNA